MKEINTTTIEQALAMHRETVSPHSNCLQEILSQIPERKIVSDRRAVRSPYTWLAITQIVTLCFIMIVVMPTIISSPDDGTLSYSNDIKNIDSDVENFELNLDTEDYDSGVSDSLLL